jgi:hypothetical protein
MKHNLTGLLNLGNDAGTLRPERVSQWISTTR